MDKRNTKGPFIYYQIGVGGGGGGLVGFERRRGA